MNKIRKSMLAVAALFTVASVSAQQPRGQERTPEDRAKFMSERMAEKLDLTDSQKQQIYDLHLEFAKDAEATRPERPEGRKRGERGEKPTEEELAKMKEAREAMAEKHKEKMAEFDANIKNILTAEQYEKYEKARENGRRNDRGPGMRDGGRGPHPGQAPGPENGQRRRPHHSADNAKQKDCTCQCTCNGSTQQ